VLSAASRLRRAAQRWPRSSGLLAAVAFTSAATFGWAGWELLRQEGAAEEQRERERLERQADRTVQAIERALAEVGIQLDATLAAPSAPLPTVSEGMVLLFDQSGIRPGSPSALVFYPSVPGRTEPSETIFAAAEIDEFQRHALPRAATTYRRLAQSPDAAVRAASLLRLARVLRRQDQQDAALEVYRRLAELEDVPVVGAPAALVARDAEMRLMEQRGSQREAAALASALQRDLASGLWTVTRGQHEHFAAEASRISGRVLPSDDRLAAAYATTDFWNAWRDTPSPRGRMVVGPAERRYLVMWQSGASTSAAWVSPLDRLLSHIPLEARQNTSLIEAASPGSRVRTQPGVVRTSAETGLPFNVQAAGPSAPVRYGLMSRGRLVVAALGVMLAFLLAASYFISRAAKREMALVRQQADFVSAVSHEFRTPLASMRQLSELLAEGRVVNDTRRQHYYESLAAESRRLQRLVENLLEFGRLETGPRPYHIEPLDPRALMSSAVADFQSQLGRADCRIEMTGQPDAPVLADRDAMTLVFHNLLDNAVKYSGGRSVRMRCEREGDRIAFSVSDEGPGISVEDRQRIFQRFVRGASAAATNAKGTGLGLAMVKLIVTGHGGEVRVDSRPDTGSTFTVILPARH